MDTISLNLETFVQELVNQTKLRGIVAIQGNSLEITKETVAGYRRFEDGELLQRDDLFRIASMTKPITAFAILQLIDKGEIGLDTNVSDIFPEFSKMNFAEIRENDFKLATLNTEITIHQLLNHTIGYHSPMFYPGHPFGKHLQDLATVKIKTLEDHIEFLSNYPLIYTPGHGWSYGFASDLLGAIIHKVTGKPIDTYFKEHIFKPLKMDNTSYYVDDDKKHRLSNAFKRVDGNLIEQTENEFIYRHNQYARGSGGLVSTVQDYAKFIQHLLLTLQSKNKVQLLSKELVEKMVSNQVDHKYLPLQMGPMSLTDWGFGYGLAVKYGESDSFMPGSIGSFYWMGAFNTFFIVDPSKDIFLILMSQVVVGNPATEIVNLQNFAKFIQ